MRRSCLLFCLTSPPFGHSQHPPRLLHPDLLFIQPRRMTHGPAAPTLDICLPVSTGRLWGRFLKSEWGACGLVE